MHRLLQKLLALPPAQRPLVSVYLDLRPSATGQRDGHRQREGLLWAERRLAHLERSFPARSPDRASFSADRERVLSYLHEKLRPDTRGLALFACGDLDLFEALPVALPFENRLSAGPVPLLYPLVRVLENSRSFLIVQVDSSRARIHEVALGSVQAVHTVENPLEKPPEQEGHHRSGGFLVGRSGGAFGATELVFQRYMHEQVRHHLKEVAQVMAEHPADLAVLAGDSRVVAELRGLLSPTLGERVLEPAGLDLKVPDHVMLRRALDLVEKHSAEQAGRKVGQAVDDYLSGGLATLRLGPTLEALHGSRVDDLLLAEDFAGSGWGCLACGALLDLLDNAQRCLWCEGEVEPLEDLREALVRRAEATGARVTIVPAGTDLDRHGGVGAVLRYLAPRRETATV